MTGSCRAEKKNNTIVHGISVYPDTPTTDSWHPQRVALAFCPSSRPSRPLELRCSIVQATCQEQVSEMAKELVQHSCRLLEDGHQ